MRPRRKSRSVNNWHDYFRDIYSVKYVNKSKRENHKKKKLSDMPQWSKEELSCFYEAYRKYGKDWEKVAAVVRNRSVEMVESMYTMNMAYLSLPEGTASVVGFIAMMLEHYSNLGRSDCEQERNDGAAASWKPQKQARGKAEPGNSEATDGKFNAFSLSAASGNGCMPLMKRKHTGGKRTPMLPVSYSCENVEGEKFLPLTKQNWKKKADVNAAALEIENALTEASAKGVSPQVYQTPNRRTASVMLSPVQDSEIKCAGLKMANAKPVENDRNDEHLEGSMKVDTSKLSRHRTYLKQSGQVAPLVQKGRSIDAKKLDADDSRDNHFEDQTEIGQRSATLHEKINSDARIARSSLQGSRKKSKMLHLSRDEVAAIEALQTLADLSLKIPSGGNEDDSRVQIKEDKDDHLHEFGSLKATTGKSQRPKRRSSGVTVKGDRSITRFEVASSKILKSGKGSTIDDKAVPEMAKEANRPKAVRKKQNMWTSKIWKSEAHLHNEISEISESEVRAVEEVNKSNRCSHNASPKLMKGAEQSPAQSTPQLCQVNPISLPASMRSRGKMHPMKPQKLKALKIPDKDLNEQSNTLNTLTEFAVKDKLINCLSSHQLRRWCTYEWFYSAIDYPWFAKREFVEYLCHVGLGHIRRLTRAEWGVIRRSLGKPRRFSQQLLKEEKKKLNQYRDSVRKHYNDLWKGAWEGLPQNLARPLSVGQHVVAIHPKTREIHNGNVLIVDHSRCRVQFDQPELGIEFVMDINCMPLNHLDIITTPLVRHLTRNKLLVNNELWMNAQPKDYTKAFPGDGVMNINALDKKEAAALKESEPFTKQHAAVQEANEQISSSLSHLRQRNALQETILLSWPGLVANFGDHGDPLNSLDHSACQSYSSGSRINETIESSRRKARTMVHAAMQSSLQGRDNTLGKIEEAIDIVNKQLTMDDSFISLPPDAMAIASDKNDVQIPSELITHCVATLLMIQKCTERGHPPSDIAQILQSAVTSLKPRCSQNLPAYAEIQKCMGRIKNKILAVLPT